MGKFLSVYSVSSEELLVSGTKGLGQFYLFIFFPQLQSYSLVGQHFLSRNQAKERNLKQCTYESLLRM